MSIGQFYGSALPKMHKGKRIAGVFEQVGSFFPATAPIEFGTLVKYTANKKFHEAMEGDETNANLFAGIALAEMVVAGSTYPGTKTRYEVGEAANLLIVGQVAVELSSTGDVEDIIEGGKVFLGTDGKVSTAGTTVLPNLVFTGDVEADGAVTLVGVRKLY